MEDRGRTDCALSQDAGRPLEAIEGLSDAQMTERTLDGWSIADHLAHIALWDDVRTQEVTRISAGHDSVWRMNGEQDAALQRRRLRDTCGPRVRSRCDGSSRTHATAC